MTTQTKSTHTPGPWELVHHTAPQHDGDRAIYGPGKNAKFICDMNGGPNDDSEILANARLISAAPEMLEMLYIVLPAVEEADEFNKPTHKNGPKVRAIIAKAEGRI